MLAGVPTRPGSFSDRWLLPGHRPDMRVLAPHCHFDLGKLSLRTGHRAEAREHLTTATTMYREMDMRFWLEQAEAELRRA